MVSKKITAVGTVTQPNSKLRHLLLESTIAGGQLVTQTAVGKAIGLSLFRVSQLFGHGSEAAGSPIKYLIAKQLTAAFRRDGVRVEPEWLYFSLAKFIEHVSSRESQKKSQLPTKAHDRSHSGLIL
jgi:hypothetical protein